VAAHTHDAPAASAYYDGDCRFCIALAKRFEGVLAKRDIALMPLQTEGTAALFGVTQDRLLTEMRLRLREGRMFGGADAVMEIARHIWWAWPLWALSRVPGAMRPMRVVYRWIARRRGCAGGVCERPTRTSAWWAALPLVVFPMVAMLTSSLMPRWAFMWAMAFALYAGCKWLTYWQVRVRLKPDTTSTVRLKPDTTSTVRLKPDTRSTVGLKPDTTSTVGLKPDTTASRRVLGYLFAWPGMDARAFLCETGRVEMPARSEWFAAGFKTLFGGLLVWRLARVVLPISDVVAGWVAMIGATFILHFGTFHVLSLCWRRASVDAMPVMRNPLRATSLGEFWGRRWNTAFHELASRFTFTPLRQRFGVTAATLATFVTSGLIHELVITVPAGGAYGLPTGYFVLQGLGVAGERSMLGRRLGLGGGVRGWLYTVLVVAGPVTMLFPPVFVQRVILPMLAAIGAI